MLHRAFGIDGIPAEALHAAPAAAAAAFFPVIMKCALRIEEPIQFKGGSLYAIWKGKSSPSACSAYRGILVSSTVGKAYHKILRARNVGALEAAATPLQIGGLPRRPVTLAAQVVRLHQAWNRDSGLSHAVIFLDLREAFYRIVRPLVTGFQGSDEEIAHILASVSLPHGVMHDLKAHLESTSLFERAGSSPWTAAATCEALQHTWFRFEQGELVTETGIGTRPGDNLADLIFSFVFARVLQQVRAKVEATCGLVQIPWHPMMMANVLHPPEPPTSLLSLLDCTWMDDSALVIQAQTASGLAEQVASTTGALLDSCLGRALLPNLDKGKTEAVVTVVGPGSRKCRAHMFRADPPTMQVDSALWPHAEVRLVAEYRHLGGTVHHSGTMTREIKHRVAMAWAAFNKRRKKIFASPIVCQSDKATLFESLVLSVLLFGAGTWGTLPRQDLAIISTAYHHMAASMLRPRYKVEEARHLGSSRILVLAGLPSIETLLHMARLRHLQSCVSVAAPEFWALVHKEQHWLRAVQSSLSWLWELERPAPDASQWEDQWLSWRGLMCAQPGVWKRMLKRTQARATHRESWDSACKYHRGLLGRQLRLAGGALIADVDNSIEWYVDIAFVPRDIAVKQSRGKAVPALRIKAQGPPCRLSDLPWIDEPDRPIAEVLDCLDQIGYDLGDGTDAQLWQRLREAFSCVCADTERLRLTATHYRTSLAVREHPPALSRRLFDALGWIVEADLAEWLVPSPALDETQPATFRDGDDVLRDLEVSDIAFPLVRSAEPEQTWVFVGPADWWNSPTFFDGPFRSVRFEINVGEWHGFLTPPVFSGPSKVFKALLLRETFGSDLVRFALRLWGLGVYARLWHSADSLSSLNPLPDIRAIEQGTAEGKGFLVRYCAPRD
ncbi:unnamed protein product [Symbiodinium sp. CCMP2456]|nr:unnamed protein product [Symbiodinium sp. CCMP2456]